MIALLLAAAAALAAPSPLLPKVLNAVERHYYYGGPFEVLARGEPENLAGFWLMFREGFLYNPLPPRRRELLGAYVSELRGCSFCMEAHRAFADLEEGGVLAPDDPAALRARWKLRGGEAPPKLDAAERAGVDALVLIFGVANRVMDALGPEFGGPRPKPRGKDAPPREELLPPPSRRDEALEAAVGAELARAWVQAQDASERATDGWLAPGIKAAARDAIAGKGGTALADSLPEAQRPLARFLIHVAERPARLKDKRQPIWLDVRAAWSEPRQVAATFWVSLLAAREDALRRP